MRPHLVVSHVLVLHLGAAWTAGFGGIINLAKACFERSCELPLALIITSSVSESSRLPNLAMDLVLPVRHRIRHLELSLPAVFTESLFKLPRSSLMALRSIDISVLTDGHGTWFRSMSALEGAPRLNSVKFGAIYSSAPTFDLHFPVAPQIRGKLRFDPCVAGLPWGQLTELCFADVEIRCDDALHMLGMANALVRAKLDVHILRPLMPAIAFTTSIVPPTPPEPPRRQPPVSAPRPARAGSHNQPMGRGKLPRRALRQTRSPLHDEALDQVQAPTKPPVRNSPRSANALGVFAPAVLPHQPHGRQPYPALAPLTDALARDADPPLLPRLVALTLIDRWVEETLTVPWVRATKAVV
ncbi:hypothetical protein FB451DRAFT_1419286 [Mycena latifolia]|nr:hypothetical protein FB451DRAFT_1419286 [Mycena latifolia]